MVEPIVVTDTSGQVSIRLALEHVVVTESRYEMDWDDLVESVTTTHSAVKVSQMFGAPCVKRDTGKVAFCSWQSDVVFKLVDEGARTQALALEGAALFDPGMGRTMREWVLVPAAHSSRWVELAGLSLADCSPPRGGLCGSEPLAARGRRIAAAPVAAAAAYRCPVGDRDRAHERYDDIVDAITAWHDDCRASLVFGMPCVKRAGRVVFGLSRTGMVFKLTEPDVHARALAVPGAHLFDPSGRGEAFRQWVVVPPAQAGEWDALAYQAVAQDHSIPPPPRA